MMSANHFTITVSGGDIESNSKMTREVQQALQQRHFTNVHVDAPLSYMTKTDSVADLVRSLAPELLNAPVRIVPESHDKNPFNGPFDFCSDSLRHTNYNFSH